MRMGREAARHGTARCLTPRMALAPEKVPERRGSRTRITGAQHGRTWDGSMAAGQHGSVEALQSNGQSQGVPVQAHLGREHEGRLHQDLPKQHLGQGFRVYGPGFMA